jgi:hypothetical protein
MLGRESRTAMTTAVVSVYPSLFRQVVSAALQRAQPYLAVSLRTDVFVNQWARRRVEKNLETLFSHPLAPRFTLTSPAEALAVLEPGAETTNQTVAAI